MEGVAEEQPKYIYFWLHSSPTLLTVTTSLRLLALCAALIFLGRGYQYIFWSSPLSVLLWDEGLMSPFIEGILGMDWNDYASDVNVSVMMGKLQRSIGWLWSLAAVAAGLSWKINSRWLRLPIFLGTFFLVLHALLETKDHFYHLAQFFEYGIQIGAPALLLTHMAGSIQPKKLLVAGKIAIAVTFAAHGLYALGFYPVPGNFVDMTIIILGVGESTAKHFLTVVGWLDLLVAVSLFFGPTARYTLLYATVWGLLTAFARVVAGWQLGVEDQFWHQYLYQTVFRIPHGLLPFTIWWMSRHPKSATIQNLTDDLP